MEVDLEIDAKDLLCPLPVLKARKALAQMPSGAVLKILASDPAAIIDMPHFCNEAGHRLLNVTAQGDCHVYLIRRG